MALRRFAAPAATPVSLSEAKSHVRVIGSDDDATLTAQIEAATAHLDGADGVLGRALVTQTWDLVLDAFPAGEIRLPLPPLQSVTSVTYTDTDGASQTLDAGQYTVDTANARIVPVSSWPSTKAVPAAVVIRYVCGYGAAAAVPASIKAAILLLTGDLFENREAQGEKVLSVNETVRRLLLPYRVWRF